MEKYKSSLKTQNIVYLFGIVLLVIVQILAFCRVITPVAAGERWSSGWNGFIAGASFAMTAFLVLGLVWNLRALKNEKALKKLYAREHDERVQEIARRAQSFGVEVFLLGMIPVTIVCGYFSITVALTCLACLLALAFIVCGAKLYWSRKL